ncbi:MAG: VOC family protein [Burkholderiaceae bacterium]|nr:VOC family protein [Burkholderiaceae bacterium]
MKIYPYLIFNGNCAEAMTFYQQVLKGELEIVHYSDMPQIYPDTEPEDEQRVLHAHLDCGDYIIMASDAPVSQASPPLAGFSVAVMLQNVPAGQHIFDALSQGGKVTLPWAPTPWAQAFGMLTDRYGVNWMVNGGPKPKPQA